MPTLQIRERDIEILRAVHQFRVLKSQDHLQRLFGGSDRIPRRLDQLSGAGYLYRFKRPHIRSQYYYGLGNQGATLLSDRLGWPRTRVNWRLKNQRLKDKHLDHTFMIADVMIAVELAAQDQQHVVSGALRIHAGPTEAIAPAVHVGQPGAGEVVDSAVLPFHGQGRQHLRRQTAHCALRTSRPIARVTPRLPLRGLRRSMTAVSETISMGVKSTCTRPVKPTAQVVPQLGPRGGGLTLQMRF